MLPVQHHVVAGIRTVVYDSAPQASGEAVVFVHGNPGPSDDWEKLAPAAAAITRTIAMDLPGYGRAEHPHSFDFSVEGYAAYLQRVSAKCFRALTSMCCRASATGHF